MTTYQSENFENFTTGWTTEIAGSGTVTKSNDHFHGGSFSGKFYSPATADYADAYKNLDSNPAGDFHFQVYFFPDSAVTPDNIYIAQMLNTASAIQARITVGDSGGVCYVRCLNPTTYIVVCAVAYDTWHLLDAYWNSTLKLYAIWVDNAFKGFFSPRDSTKSYQRTMFGDSTSGSIKGLVYVDDLTVDDAVMPPLVNDGASHGESILTKRVMYLSGIPTDEYSHKTEGNRNISGDITPPAITLLVARTKLMADPYQIGESLFYAWIRRLLLSDPYSYKSDPLAANIECFLQLYSYITLADNVNYTKGMLTTTITDTYSLADALAYGLTRKFSLLDGFDLADDPRLSRIFSFSTADGFSLWDGPFRTFTLLRTLTDGLTHADSPRYGLSRYYTVLDAYDLADKFAELSVMRRLLTDGLSHTDTLGTIRHIRFSLADGHILYDPAYTYGIARILLGLTDSYEYSDVTAALNFISLYAMDGYSHGDALTNQRAIYHTLSEAHTIADEIRRTRSFSISILDALTHHERSQTPQISVVTSAGEVRTFKSVAQYINWLRTGRLPDRDVVNP